MNFSAGWNLIGNSSNGSFDVATAFGDASSFTSVWKWSASAMKWAFYAPTLAQQGTLSTYAASKGYDVLTTVNAGEGLWVNAIQPTSVNLLDVYALGASELGAGLIGGWNLASMGETITPKQFCAAQVTAVTTLWAWDSALSNWYFYAPSLDTGGSALADYIAGKKYLDFTTSAKTLGPGVGFWVNKP